MRCPRCQHENSADAAFCDECGTRLEAACSNCGEASRLGAKFCRKCGQRLDASAPVAAPKFRSPDAYTPKHLAEKILTSKSALEGERKQVTVLFADLKGSMELLADRDPEEARKLLDPVLERMMEAVHRYEGTVNQVMGDGIMALFGAPVAHEDHAVRACYAALRMQESVKQYAEGVRRAEGILIQIRVGLNSGAVVVRSVGNDLHMDYTAVGQTTHLAARMEQVAAPGSILATAEVLRLAEGYVGVKSLGPVNVKGLKEPVEVYEVTGAGPVRTRLQAAAARGLTRFVGRQAEVEALRDALEKARGGHGQVVALVGEPGVGKSRLFWEFTHSHRTQGWLILESGSVSYGKATAYLPVVDLLKAYFQIEARDDGRKIREKVTGKLLTLDEALRPTLVALFALLDVGVEDPAWQALDPSQRRQRTLEAVKHLLLRESHVQPLCVVLEDLHWIDSETQAFLDSLVESLPTARLLLLVNYRPEYQHGWGSKTYYTQLRIDPLPPERADELLQALLGDGAGLKLLKQLLIERTEGNPLFLEESVRNLVETQALVGERGAYQLVKELPDIQVPATVQAILAARIDRLPPEGKTLLQTAAVIGKDVPYALLDAIAELPEETLRRTLTHLQASEFLYEATLFPELEYTFKHALTHEVTYGSLLGERRRTMHARIVEVMERLDADRLAEHVERLAHHAVLGEQWDRAVEYSRQAGAKAIGRSAPREGSVLLEQALSALGHLPQTRRTTELAIDLRLDLPSALIPFGELRRMHGALTEAEGLAETLDDRPRLGRIYSHLANCLYLGGRPSQAVEMARRALALASELGDLATEIGASVRLGIAYLALGDTEQAIEIWSPLLDRLQGDLATQRFGLPTLPSVSTRSLLARCLAERGDFTKATALAAESLRVAATAGHAFSQAWAHLRVAQVHLIKGDAAEALQSLERSAELNRDTNSGYLASELDVARGRAYALARRAEEGVPMVARAVERYQAMEYMTPLAGALTAHAEVCRAAGHVTEALEIARRAVEMCRRNTQRAVEAMALYTLADALAVQAAPDSPAADSVYLDALEAATRLGLRPLVAHCHLGLGKLYRRTGERAKSNEQLATATPMYREMDMGFYLAQAEAALHDTR